jgi:hypothetical protein
MIRLGKVTGLKPSARHYLILLLSKIDSPLGSTSDSQQVFADEMGVSLSTVGRAEKDLASSDFIGRTYSRSGVNRMRRYRRVRFGETLLSLLRFDLRVDGGAI